MSYGLGLTLKQNMKAGRPTRTKGEGDYVGRPMSPCGDFVNSSSSSHPSMKSPWLSPLLGSTSCSLHDEIKMFMNYMEPTVREKQIREDLVGRFTNLIVSFKVHATVRPVGSYGTGLYLPTSDIDMVLTFNDVSTRFQEKYALYQILDKIRGSGFASKVEDIMKAAVPLIRITDKVTGIEIDLTGSDTHGVEATKAVQKWMKTDTEVIRMLITVVKMFLSIRRCGTTYTGGVNSYVLVWMVVAWVHLEWKVPQHNYDIAVRPKVVNDLDSLRERLEKISLSMQRSTVTPISSRASAFSDSETRAPSHQTTSSVDFGEILMRFFDFYGNKFDYQQRAIKIEPRPSYQVKTRPYSRYIFTQHYLLQIFDPADGTIDMGAKAYGIKHVQASFKQAHQLLVDKKQFTNGRVAHGSRSILGEVLGGDFTAFEAKRKILNSRRS